MTIPFTNTGIAQYPSEGPMIGQEHIRDALERFLSEAGEATQDNLFIYGDWGSGKSRIGYQLVAEFNGKADGWLCEDKEGSGYTNIPLYDDIESTVLPLLISLSDFVDDIDQDTAAVRAFNEAVEQVLDESTEWSTDVNKQLSEYSVDELDLQTARTSSSGPRDKFENYVTTFYEGGDIDRIAVIIDEVEQVDDALETAPDNVDTAGVSQQRLRAFFEGLKRAVNNIENRLAFKTILLTTSNLEREVNQIGGFQRRKEEEHIKRPTVDQALKLTNELAAEYDLDISDQTVKALFFASSNNFGWFSSAMYTMLLQQRKAAPDDTYADIIEDNPAAFDQIFEDDYLALLKDWDSKYSDSVRESALSIIYQLLPIAKEDVSAEEDEIVNVEMVDGTRPNGPMQAIKTSRSDIINNLTINHGFEVVTGGAAGGVTTKGVTLQYGTDEIKATNLKDLLDIFRIDDNCVGIYKREEDLEQLTNFLIEGSATPDTAEKVVEMFKDLLAEAGSETTHYAPTIQFLTRWNKAWRKRKGVTRWLPEAQWEALIEEVEAITGPGDQAVAEGFAYTRFSHDVETAPREFDLDSPSIVVDIADDSIVDVVEREQAVILHQPSNVEDITTLKDDITTLKQADERPIVYLLFDSQEAKQEHVGAIHEAFPWFSPFLIDQTVDDTDLTRTFLKRFSFVGEIFDFEEHVRGGMAGQKRYTSKQESLRTRDEKWRATIEDDGWVQRPLVPRNVEEGPRMYAKGLLLFLRGNDIGTTDVSGVKSERVASVWQAAWNDAETLVTPVDNSSREFQLPPQVPRLLQIINQSETTTPSGLAGRILYDKEGTVKIKTATKQTLDVLQRIGVVIEDGEEYRFADGDALQELGSTAKSRVSAKRGPDDEQLGAYIERMETIVTDFRAKPEMIDNKIEQLEEELENITEFDFDTLAGSDEVSSDEWSETALAANSIQEQASQLYDPSLEFKESKAPDYPTKISGDNELEEYPIHFRLEYLAWLNDYLETQTDDLEQNVEHKETEVETTYAECHGKPFPTKQIESVLEAIKADLSLESEVSLPDSLKTDQTDKTIQGHLNVFEIDEMFDRIQWYTKFLEQEFEKDDPWTEFTNAYQTMESILETWDRDSDTITTTKDFVDDSPYEDELTAEQVDISGESGGSDQRSLASEWSKIERTIEDPKGLLEDSSNSVATLREDIEQLKQMVIAFREHAENVYRRAKEDLREQRDALDYHILKSLAAAVDTTTGVDLPDIEPYDRYVDCQDEINETETAIEEEGQDILRNALSGGAECWPLYKKVHQLDSEGEDITSEVLDDTERTQLTQLRDNGILDYEETEVYDVRLE